MVDWCCRFCLLSLLLAVSPSLPPPFVCLFRLFLKQWCAPSELYPSASFSVHCPLGSFSAVCDLLHTHAWAFRSFLLWSCCTVAFCVPACMWFHFSWAPTLTQEYQTVQSLYLALFWELRGCFNSAWVSVSPHPCQQTFHCGVFVMSVKWRFLVLWISSPHLLNVNLIWKNVHPLPIVLIGLSLLLLRLWSLNSDTGSLPGSLIDKLSPSLL